MDGPSWDHLEISDQVFGVAPAVTLDEANDDVGAPLASSVTLVEHGVGLPDSCGGAEVDPEVAGRLDAVGVLAGGLGVHRHCGCPVAVTEPAYSVGSEPVAISFIQVKR